MRAAKLIAALAVIDIGAVIAAQPLYPAGSFDLLGAVLFTSAVASFAGVGAILAIRVPGNRVGALLLAAGTLLALEVFAGSYALAGAAAQGGPWPGTAFAAWIGDLIVVPIVIVAAGVPAIFPDGRLPSPRWRWLPWLLVAGTSLAVLTPAFAPGPVGEDATSTNPMAIDAIAPLLPIADSLSTLIALPAFLGALAAVATRFRRGNATERRQIKWLLYVALVSAIAFPVAFVFPGTPVSDIAFPIGFAALAALPIAIGIAVLRYRLYEIDRIISRTIAWAVMTGLLVAVFVLAVVGLQALLAGFTQGETLAVAASTLIAAALFQPLRGRVQGAVDQRFDRARYDGERVVAAFGATVRDEVDLEVLAREVRQRRRRDRPPDIDCDLAPQRHEAHRRHRFRNDVRTPVPEDAPMTSLITALPPPHRPHRAGRRGPAVPVAAAVPAEQPGIAIDIPESDPLFAYLQAAPGPVDIARLELASPALEQLRDGRRRARRAAGDPGRADRNAQPRPAPLRAGLLDRRPAAPRDARRPGRPGDPCRAARARAGGRGRRARALRAGAAGSRSSSSSSSCRASCRTCPSGRSPRTTAPPAWSAATSTTSSTSARAGSASSSAT